MVSYLLWRVAFSFDQDLEPVLPKLWKGFWFWIFYAFVACGSCSIASRVPFPLGNSFHFTENHFRLLQKHPFRQIWRYNVTVTDLFFFLNLSYFISLLLDLLCFSLGLLFSLTAYALCRAPCAIAANQKQRGKVFFLSSRLRMLFAVHLVRSRQIRNNEKTWKYTLFR